MPPEQGDTAWYGLRSWSEQFFKDAKRGGWQWQQTRMTEPARAERQGSLVWVASAEWRVPLAKEVHWDVCDHVFGARNLYGAMFYDIGDAYTRGHAVGPIAHALGAGIRMDLAIFGFVERSTLRFDVAKTVNADSPLQFWLGIQHPF